MRVMPIPDVCPAMLRSHVCHVFALTSCVACTHMLCAQFPMTAYMVAGTQAEEADKNQVSLVTWMLCRTSFMG